MGTDGWGNFLLLLTTVALLGAVRFSRAASTCEDCTIQPHLPCSVTVYDKACPVTRDKPLKVPSAPTDLRVEDYWLQFKLYLKVSWRIPADSSATHVTGFNLDLDGDENFRCYHFNLSQANWTDNDVHLKRQYNYSCIMVLENYNVSVHSLPAPETGPPAGIFYRYKRPCYMSLPVPKHWHSQILYTVDNKTATVNVSFRQAARAYNFTSYMLVLKSRSDGKERGVLLRATGLPGAALCLPGEMMAHSFRDVESGIYEIYMYPKDHKWSCSCVCKSTWSPECDQPGNQCNTGCVVKRTDSFAVHREVGPGTTSPLTTITSVSATTVKITGDPANQTLIIVSAILIPVMLVVIGVASFIIFRRKRNQRPPQKPDSQISEISSITNSEAPLVYVKPVEIVKTNVLLICCHKSDLHVSLVSHLASFLEGVCECQVTDASKYSNTWTDLAGYRAWLHTQIISCDKIVLVNSKRAYNLYKEVLHGGVVNHSRIGDELFIMTVKQLRSQLPLSSKMVTAHFDSNDKQHCIRELQNPGEQSLLLMDKISELFCKLHGLDKPSDIPEPYNITLASWEKTVYGKRIIETSREIEVSHKYTSRDTEMSQRDTPRDRKMSQTDYDFDNHDSGYKTSELNQVPLAVITSHYNSTPGLFHSMDSGFDMLSPDKVSEPSESIMEDELIMINNLS